MSLFIQHTISDARSEPVPERKPNSSQSRPPPPPTASSTTASPAAAPYEYSPGCMSDGTMSANHWAVQLFVKRIGHVVEEAEAEQAAQPENAPWHVTTGHRVSWWRAEKAGILQAGDGWTACRTHVEHLLADLGPGGWSLDIVKAIFVLGALSALPFPGYAAFWAFWGTNSAGTTADVVQSPSRHSSPSRGMCHGSTRTTACGLSGAIGMGGCRRSPIRTREEPKNKVPMEAQASCVGARERENRQVFWTRVSPSETDRHESSFPEILPPVFT